MLRLINSKPELVTQKLTRIGILLKFNLSRKELNSLTYPVYLKIKSIIFYTPTYFENKESVIIC